MPLQYREVMPPDQADMIRTVKEAYDRYREANSNLPSKAKAGLAKQAQAEADAAKAAYEKEVCNLRDVDGWIGKVISINSVVPIGRNDALQAHHAGVPEQVRADLALRDLFRREDRLGAHSQLYRAIRYF